jgi:DNA (cytosine-5)-methyltransferase 1
MLYLADFPVKTFPQQDGGGGIDGERSGMWKEMARIIGEVRPQYAFIENSPMLTTRGLERILADLAQMGFDARWGVLSAADVGANHLRERIWIVAENTNARREYGQQGNARKLATSKAKRSASAISNQPVFAGLNKDNWKTEPDVVRMVNGVADGVDRLKAIGNGQVPLCAATAWEILSQHE